MTKSCPHVSEREVIVVMGVGFVGAVMAGIVADLVDKKTGKPYKDFVIQEESDKGYPGLINLIGIESPGLTACLPIADHVAMEVRS